LPDVLPALRAWVREIVVVAVLVGYAELLVPAGEIKRYARLVMGLIVLFAILRPAAAFVAGWDGRLPELSVRPWTGWTGTTTSGVEEGVEALARVGEAQAVRTLASRIENAAEAAAVEVEGVRGARAYAAVERGTDGALERVRLRVVARCGAASDEERAESGRRVLVEPVTVHVGARGVEVEAAGHDGESAAKVPDALREEMEARIAGALGLPPGDVEVELVIEGP